MMRLLILSMMKVLLSFLLNLNSHHLVSDIEAENFYSFKNMLNLLALKWLLK